MTTINNATSQWWESFGTVYKDGAFKNFYYELLSEIVRVLHVTNYEISNKHIAEFIDPKFHKSTILQFLKEIESEALSAFIKYDKTYREKMIATMLPPLLDNESAEIKEYVAPIRKVLHPVLGWINPDGTEIVEQ